MNINSQYYPVSDMDSNYENFGLDQDWLLMGGMTSFTNQEDILQDILGLEEVLNQSRGLNDHIDIQRQSQTNAGTSELTSVVNKNHNIDQCSNTDGALPAVSLPGCGSRSVVAVGISSCSSGMDTNIDESNSASAKPAYQETNNKCKKDQVKAAKSAANCLKTLTERNKEAARAYRKRRRNEEQELEIKFGFLKKKKVVLEEELKSLKELYSKKSYHKKVAQEGLC